MGEPFSVIVSALTIAETAAKSCEVLYTSLRRFSEAPKDIQHHVAALRALQSTFAGISALEQEEAHIALITPEFKARLEACMLDLQSMEKTAKSFDAQLEEGRLRRTWTKIRWSSLDQRQTFKSHLSRIESYHTTFSLELLLLNITLGLHRHKENHLDRVGPPHAPGVPTDLLNPYTEKVYPLKTPQSQSQEQLSIRNSRSTYLEKDLVYLLLRFGPIILPGRHNTQLSSNPNSSSGYGLSIATAFRGYRPFSIELAVYLTLNSKGPGIDCSLQWSLSWPRVVSWDDKIINLAMYGDIENMKSEFSRRTASPFDQSPDGLTLLHLATSQGHFEMIKFLIQEGAKVNAVNQFGETPLHCAIALSKDYNIPRILVDNGGDLQNRDVEGRTPLHTFPSPVSEQILNGHGSLVDCSSCDDHGISLLHYLAWSSKTSPQTFQKYHERSTFDLKTVDREGRSILHLAAQRGNVPVIEYVISTAKVSLVNQKDRRGRGPLHYAVETKRAEATITLLVSHGADLHAKDHEERSALQHAAKLGNLVAVQTLVRLGNADYSNIESRLCIRSQTVARQTYIKAGKGRLLEERRSQARLQTEFGYTWVSGAWKSLTGTFGRCVSLYGDLIAYCGWTKSAASTDILCIALILLLTDGIVYENAPIFIKPED